MIAEPIARTTQRCAGVRTTVSCRRPMADDVGVSPVGRRGGGGGVLWLSVGAYSMVGMTKSAPARMPVGQRVVMVFRRV